MTLGKAKSLYVVMERLKVFIWSWGFLSFLLLSVILFGLLFRVSFHILSVCLLEKRVTN